MGIEMINKKKCIILCLAFICLSIVDGQTNVTSAPTAPLNSTVWVSPVFLTEEGFFSPDPTVRKLVFTFPTQGSWVLDTSAVDWPRFVTITAAAVDGAVQPYGFGGYRDQLCPDQCVYSVNNTIVLQFDQVTTFDLYADQTLIVTFGLRLTPRSAVQASFRINIVADALTPDPQAYFLSAVLIPVHIASSFLLPATLDTAGLVLASQVTCSRSAERLWVPGSLYAVLPFGGDTLFDRSWRLGVFLAVVYAALLTLLKFNSFNFVDARRTLRVREMLPFVAGQIVLFLAPGLSFAAGSLLTSPSPSFQVLGVGVIAGVLLTSYAMHGWLYRADEWLYEPVTRAPLRDKHTLMDRVMRIFHVRGHWINEVTPYRVTKIVPREPRGEFVQRRAMLALWIVTMSLYVIAGIAPPNPVSCVAQGACVGTAWVLTGLLILRLRPYRAAYLDITAGLLRFGTGCAFGLVALQPDQSKYILFCLIMAGGIVLEVPRILYAAIFLRRASSDAARDHQVKKQHIFELHQQRQLELEMAMKRREEEAAAAAKAAEEEAALEAMNAPLLVFPVPSLNTRMVSDEEATKASINAAAAAAYVAAESLYGPNDPKYLREASKIKPRINPGDQRLSLKPAWVPDTRPHVRPTNEPDLPLPAFFMNFDPNAPASQPLVERADHFF